MWTRHDREQESEKVRESDRRSECVCVRKHHRQSIVDMTLETRLLTISPERPAREKERERERGERETEQKLERERKREREGGKVSNM